MLPLDPLHPHLLNLATVTFLYYLSGHCGYRTSSTRPQVVRKPVIRAGTILQVREAGSLIPSQAERGRGQAVEM